MSLLNELLLNEANVFNASIPYKNVSIKQFVQQHIGNNIADPEITKILTKKLSTFLINDERFLQPIRQLPDDAPEWAQQAAATGQLMVFVPNQQLNDVVSNIIHYVQAAEQNLDATDNNIIVQAQRELASIVKQPNLDELAGRADQYFKATASKQSVKDIEGMNGIVDYDGWIWYKLDTHEAFVREGNTLQNCIGKHWTHEKTNREGMQIYILRTPANDSVVAVRAKDKKVFEIKGKNNKPPVEKYMQPVFKFIRDYQFDISSAEHELIRAGYYVFNNNLIVPLAQASTMYFDEEQGKLLRIEPDDVIDVNGIETEVYTNKSAIQHMFKIANRAFNPYSRGEEQSTITAIYKAENTLFPIRHKTITILKSSGPVPENISTFVKQLATQEHLAIESSMCVPLGLSSIPPFNPITETVTELEAVGNMKGFDVSRTAPQDKWAVATSYSFGDDMGTWVSIKLDDFISKTGTSLDDIAVIYRHIRYQSTNLVITLNAKNQINGVVSTGYGMSSVNVRDAINAVIADRNATLPDKKALKGMRGLVVISPTQVATKEDFVTGKLQSAATNHVLEFEDGSTFTHLSGERLKKFVNDAGILSMNPSHVYQLVKNDEVKLVVPITKKGITKWYAPQYYTVNLGDAPTEKTASIQYGPYIKALSRELNVPIVSKENTLTTDSGMYMILRYLAQRGAVSYNDVVRASGARNIFGRITERVRRYNPLTELFKLGLINIQQTGARKSSPKSVSITNKGSALLRQVVQGEISSLFDIIPTKDIQSKSGVSKHEPEPTQRAVREPRPEGQPRPGNNAVGRTGTKATEAYNKYVEMTRANNGTQPTRAQFIAILREPPFNMTPAGASTYQYNIKTKYQQQQGNLGESFTFKEWLMAIL